MLILLTLLLLAIITIALIIRAQEKAMEERWIKAMEAKDKFRKSLQSEEEVLTYDIYDTLSSIRNSAWSLDYRISNLFG